MSEIYGRNPVLELLKSGNSINKILIAKGYHKGIVQEIINIARKRKIPFQEVDRKFIEKNFPGKNHQGVVAYTSSKEYVEWQDILSKAREKGEEPLILMLDGIEDPHNFGAIMRTADSVGAHGIIIPKRRSVQLTEGVAKASAGAIEYVPVARVANLAQTAEKLKEEGCWIVGASLEGESLFQQDLKGPLVVVIGSEGKGISRILEQKCDFLVSIPMRGNINSLNASVATGVVLYEIYRQRYTVNNHLSS